MDFISNKELQKMDKALFQFVYQSLVTPLSVWLCLPDWLIDLLIVCLTGWNNQTQHTVCLFVQTLQLFSFFFTRQKLTKPDWFSFTEMQLKTFSEDAPWALSIQQLTLKIELITQKQFSSLKLLIKTSKILFPNA